jgi:hypothetical protein
MKYLTSSWDSGKPITTLAIQPLVRSSIRHEWRSRGEFEVISDWWRRGVRNQPARERRSRAQRDLAVVPTEPMTAVARLRTPTSL